MEMQPFKLHFAIVFVVMLVRYGKLTFVSLAHLTLGVCIYYMCVCICMYGFFYLNLLVILL